MKTKSDFPRRIKGTLTVHWKYLARRLLLTCSGAGSTELSPKPAEGRCNSPRQIVGTLTVHLETSGSRKWRDSPGRLRVLGKYIKGLVTVKHKKWLPQTDRGTQTVHRKHLATNSLPGDCCSPAQVQDHWAQSRNQQALTKDLADEIKTYWCRRQV